MHSPVHYFIAQERATHLRYEAERSRVPYVNPRPPFLAQLKSRLNGRLAHAARDENLNGHRTVAAERVNGRGRLAIGEPAERLNRYGRRAVAEPAERLNGRPAQSESCA
jgi:hypothetical protein